MLRGLGFRVSWIQRGDGRSDGGRAQFRSLGSALIVRSGFLDSFIIWEFPKMGDPNVVPQIVGSIL